MKKFILGISCILCIASKTFGQNNYGVLIKDSQQKSWVDAIYNNLSQDEKIGQLLMVAAYTNKDEKHINEIKNLIENEHIGGLIFMQDNAQKQVELTNTYQSVSKTPLLIGIDGEWGLDMRLKNTYRFPWNMTLGAISNDQLIKEMGQQIGMQCKEMGIHINFAPVVDINTNPANPIIGNRSFGSDKRNVANKSIAFTEGLQSQGIIASAKHFPGHGDTNTDSHLTMPTLQQTKAQLEETELYPFNQLIKNQVGSIMVAHLQVPALESNTKIPATLSKNIVTHLLQNQMNYKGLIITDALNMKGVADQFPEGEVELKAFLAGNDILLFSQDVPKAKATISKAIESGIITEERLAYSVKKILAAKYFVGLNNYKPLVTSDLYNRLITPENKALHEKLIEQAITVVENKSNILPFKDLNKRYAVVNFEEDSSTVFNTYLNKYINCDKITIQSVKDIDQLKKYDEIIIGIHKSNAHAWKSYSISKETTNLLTKITEKNTNTHLVVFASPYSLIPINTKGFKSVTLSYQNSEEAQKATPQILFGAIDAVGKLPVTINQYQSGTGINLQNLKRLSYGEAQSVGMNENILHKIDGIAQKAIAQQMTPGMQVLVARKGKVIFEKSYGTTDINTSTPVTNDHIYDLASITKITGTLPMLFKLHDEGKLDWDQPLETYVDLAKGTNKANLKIREILAHQAGLTPWIPFQSIVFDSTQNYNPKWISNKYSSIYNKKISDYQFVNKEIRDSIYNIIYQSDLQAKKYKYSDLGLYMMFDMVEKSRQKRMDEIVTEEFFKPMGAYTMRYNPLNIFDKSRIVPTEYDQEFRKQLVWGYVHDQGAALLGGVAGHAGLFSTANDLAKMMQMYLQKGYYGGKQFIQPATIEEAIKAQYPSNRNHRGIGFDKKPFDKIGQTCESATYQVYGHSGFTGNITWVDPEKEIVYVFLSNRINANNKVNKLSKGNIREDIFQLIYDAVEP